MVRHWEDSKHLMQDGEMNAISKAAYQAILDRQRAWLLELNNRKQLLDEEVVRKHLRYLDLEEDRLQYL